MKIGLRFIDVLLLLFIIAMHTLGLHVCFFLAIVCVDALPAATVLNQLAIHTAYNEGDFEQVVQEIEDFTGKNKTYSSADSIFIAKHLAVVYSANTATREKGKYYMHRLLVMVPSAELVDMYVSDEIYRIFEWVRKEFSARKLGNQYSRLPLGETGDIRQSPFAETQSDTTLTMAKPHPHGLDSTHTGTVAASPDTAAPSPGKWGKADEVRKFWIAGGVAAVTVTALGTYLLFSAHDDPAGSKPKDKVDVEVITPPQ